MDRCSLYGNPCIGCKPGPCSSRVRTVESERKTEPPKYEGKWANDLDHKAMAAEFTILDPLFEFGTINKAIALIRVNEETKRGERDMLNELIVKLRKWRDMAKESPYSGLKEHVIYDKVLREVEELQVNMEIRDRIRAEQLEMAIANYFIMHIQEGHNELDPVDTNADIQKIVRECLWLQKESAI